MMPQVYKYPEQDTHIQQDFGPQGFADHLDVISNPAPGFETRAQALIQFDMDLQIAANREVKVNDAWLKVAYTFDQFGLPTVVHLCQCPGGWSEGTASWDSMNGPIEGSGPSSIGVKKSDGGINYIEFADPGLIAIVEAWANGQANNGFLISPNLPEGQATPEALRLTSREGWPAPTLYIDFTALQPDNPEA